MSTMKLAKPQPPQKGERQYKWKMAAYEQALKEWEETNNKMTAAEIKASMEKVDGNRKKKVLTDEGEPGVEAEEGSGDKKAKRKASGKRPTISNSGGTRHTIESADQWQRAFEFFNSRLFDGELPEVLIQWEHQVKKGKPAWCGMFQPKRWGESRGVAEIHYIGIDPVVHYLKNDKETLQTLVHEMCHLWVEAIGKGKIKPFHCKRWAAKMEECGLTPIIVTAKGEKALDKNGEPKKTGRYATDTLVAGGQFDRSADELIETGFKLVYTRIPDPIKEKKPKEKKPPKRVDHVCPDCDHTVKDDREAVLYCGQHGKKPVKMLPDVEDPNVEEQLGDE